jgi:hypothetical protein
MKKNYLKLAVISLIIQTSCNKENLFKDSNVNNTNNVLENIDYFSTIIEETKLNNEASYKSHNTNQNNSKFMKFDVAIWLLEAQLNYKFDDTLRYDEYQNEKYSINLKSILRGSEYFVNETDLAIAYLTIENEIFNYLNEANKSIIAVDLNNKTNINPLTGEKDFLIEVTTYMTSKLFINNYCQDFQTTDYWTWWNPSSSQFEKCNGYNGGLNSDAAKEISKKINGCSGRPMCNGRVFYTNVSQEFIQALNHQNPNDNVLNDNYYDYLLYASLENSPNFHSCLSPQEMNFYRNSATELGKTVLPNSTYTVIKYDVHGDIVPSTFEKIYVHNMNVIYGKPNCDNTNKPKHE